MNTFNLSVYGHCPKKATCNFVYQNFETKVVEFTLSQADIHPKETNFISRTRNCMRQRFGAGWNFFDSRTELPQHNTAETHTV